jgi:hypothetical protein
MKDFFREILDTRSMTVIMYQLDEKMAAATPEEKVVFEQMQNTNKLDEVYALAHEQLGEHEEAKRLRDWMEQQANKPKFDPML